MSEKDGWVFVVDDDVAMRRALEDLIRSVGLEVEVFSSAQQFLRRQDLLDAIQQALERERKAREQRMEIVELRRRVDSLTPRERDVLNLVVAGLLNKQIAGQLGTSEATVKIHRHRVMEKWGQLPGRVGADV